MPWHEENCTEMPRHKGKTLLNATAWKKNVAKKLHSTKEDAAR